MLPTRLSPASITGQFLFACTRNTHDRQGLTVLPSLCKQFILADKCLLAFAERMLAVAGGRSKPQLTLSSATATLLRATAECVRAYRFSMTILTTPAPLVESIASAPLRPAVINGSWQRLGGNNCLRDAANALLAGHSSWDDFANRCAGA